MQKIWQRCQTFVMRSLILPALESNLTTRPEGSTDNSTKWFIENQDTVYRLKKLHKIVIYCLLTNKISVFFPNARLLLNSFLKRVASFLREII